MYRVESSSLQIYRDAMIFSMISMTAENLQVIRENEGKTYGKLRLLFNVMFYY